MSTLSGITSKGEKTKSKFQSLDINNLYRVSRGESLETHQQKSALPRKHGMQSLGKVPSARRAPANLPSLKSEHSGNDPAVSLVPTGGSGWGSKPGETGPAPAGSMSGGATTPTANVQSSAASTQHVQPPPPPQSALLPPPPALSPQQPQQSLMVQQSMMGHVSSVITTGSSDKSWSAVMAGEPTAVPSFLVHQSPQFHQEFPKLSGDAAGGAGPGSKSEQQYGPGPSLRPQTEGSWIQGGSRPQGAMGGSNQLNAPVQGHLHPGVDVGGGRNSLVPCGVGGAQGGPTSLPQHIPPHFRGVMPPFMFRAGFPGGFPPNFQGGMHGMRPRFPYPPDSRYLPGTRVGPNPNTATDQDEHTPRPIIKEEDLNRMDDIARDAGWALHDDIDYNQKLAFSDDEGGGGGGEEDSSGRSKGLSRHGAHAPQPLLSSTQTQPQHYPLPERELETTDRELAREKQPTSRESNVPWGGNRAPMSHPAAGEFRPSSTSPAPVFPPQPIRTQSSLQAGSGPGRGLEEDEVWRERRRQQSEEVAIAVERAKQRKEEEEKRFDQTRQAAAKKLQKLEEKLRVKASESKDSGEERENTPTPSIPAPTVSSHSNVNIPLPDWEKEKESDNNKEKDEDKEKLKEKDKEEKPVQQPQQHSISANKDAADNFRQMTQLEGRSSFLRERERDMNMRAERDRASDATSSGGGGQPAMFSRQFQNTLPPRFQKQQAERLGGVSGGGSGSNGSGGSGNYFRQTSAGGSSQSPQPLSQLQSQDARWQAPAHNFQGATKSSLMRRNRNDSDVSDRDRERERDKDRERDRERERDRDREREREREWEESKEQPRDRRDRHTPDQNYDRDSRYRHGGPGRGGGYETLRKPINSYDSQPDYGRGYFTQHSAEFESSRHQEKEHDDRETWESRRGRNEKEWEGENHPHYEDRDRRESNKKTNDNYKTRNTVQQPDQFEERPGDRERENGGEWRESERRGEGEQRKMERPQRPDSRDSRASRESRNSRDSNRDEQKSIAETVVSEREFLWADEPEPKEEKPRKKEMYREDRRENHGGPYHHQTTRHIPGPITREKLEASELRNEPRRNLTQLVRSDKKVDTKKQEKAESKTVEGAWGRVPVVPSPPLIATVAPTPITGTTTLSTDQQSELWADATEDALPDKITQDNSANSQSNKDGDIRLEVGEKEIETVKCDERKRDQSGSRETDKGGGGGSRGRSNRQGGPAWRGSYAVYRGHSWAGGNTGRRGTGSLRPQRSGAAGQRTDSEEDQQATNEQRDVHRLAPRSPKQSGGGQRKSEKDERNRESRRNEGEKSGGYGGGGGGERRDRGYEKRDRGGERGSVYDGGSGGFQPRGQPSRRGRGGFRTRGAGAVGAGRRMDGYGPPSSKSPFASHSADDKKHNSTDEKSEHGNKEEQERELTVEEKMKIKQQALSAGIIGSGVRSGNKSHSGVAPRLQKKSESERDRERDRPGARSNKSSRKGGSGSGGEEAWETTSEGSEPDHGRQGRNYNSRPAAPFNRNRRTAQSPRSERLGGLGRGNGSGRSGSSQASSAHRDDSRVSTDPNLQGSQDARKQQTKHDKTNTFDGIDLNNFANSSEFQEVRSKKGVKGKDDVLLSRGLGSSMGRGAIGSKPNKTQLPPRLVKARETIRLQKQQLHHQDVTEMNKMNSEVNHYSVKDVTGPAPPPPVLNAWDKPITGLRASSPLSHPSTPQQQSLHIAAGTSSTANINQDLCAELPDLTHSGTSSQRSSPIGEKSLNKITREVLVTTKVVEVTVLDGTTPPVQTIIFENTNFKSGPTDLAMKNKLNSHHLKQQTQRIDKTRDRKLDEIGESGHPVGSLGGFKPTGTEMKSPNSKAESAQLPISFSKNEDNADMKLDFSFESDLSQLTDEKTSKTVGLPRSMHMVQSSTAAELDFKIQSVKKVWENTGSGMEHHNEDGGGGVVSFTPSLGTSGEGPTGLDSTPYKQETGGSVDESSSLNSHEAVYSPGSYSRMQQVQSTYSGSSVVSNQVPGMMKADPNSGNSNVCKVKPLSQPQAVLGQHQSPLSPPPPPGSFNTNQNQPQAGPTHISYQTAAQYNSISAISSPPVPMYNSAQQPELYQAFQLSGVGCSTQLLVRDQKNEAFAEFDCCYSLPRDQIPYGMRYPTDYSDMISADINIRGTQGRSQFSQYPAYNMGQTSGYSQQSVYMPTAPPPTQPPPDLFQSQYVSRIQPQAYGQSQQLSNNSAMLIPSTSNSLISASVKPTSQQIGAIGTKGAYQTSAQPSQFLMTFDQGTLLNMNQNFMPNSQLTAVAQQRGGSNVVPTIQASSSFYSGSGAQSGFYQAANTGLQGAPGTQSIHQASTPFGMQGYSTQSPASTPVGVNMQSFSTSQLQMGGQYRTATPSYLKSSVVSGGPPQDQVPSNSSSQDVLNSVFSTAPGMASPKGRSNNGGSGKQMGGPQQQPSPTQTHQHKYPQYSTQAPPPQHGQLVMQQGGGGVVRSGSNIGGVAPPNKYPNPIQRPVNYQTNMLQPGNRGPPHQPPPRQQQQQAPPPQRHLINKPNQYYATQSVKLEGGTLESVVKPDSGGSEHTMAMTDSAANIATSKPPSSSDPTKEDNTSAQD